MWQINSFPIRRIVVRLVFDRLIGGIIDDDVYIPPNLDFCLDLLREDTCAVAFPIKGVDEQGSRGGKSFTPLFNSTSFIFRLVNFPIFYHFLRQ